MVDQTKIISPNYLKKEIEQDSLITYDLSYIRTPLEQWWHSEKMNKSFYRRKFSLCYFLLQNIRTEDIGLFDLFETKDHVAAICLLNLFQTDQPELALTVHEALSDLFQIQDIPYPYEKHKSLYITESGVRYDEWGKGYGKISPHQDDLYETIDTTYLALTVCRDKTKTPTTCYFPKDILSNFSNDELGRLIEMKAQYLSGKNVEGRVIIKEKPIISFDPHQGISFHLDFRSDKQLGERMRALHAEDQFLIDKMRKNITRCRYQTLSTETGTFLILANRKLLHARPEIKSCKDQMFQEKAYTNCPKKIPRLLFRSKGPRKNNCFDSIAEIK